MCVCVSGSCMVFLILSHYHSPIDLSCRFCVNNRLWFRIKDYSIINQKVKYYIGFDSFELYLCVYKYIARYESVSASETCISISRVVFLCDFVLANGTQQTHTENYSQATVTVRAIERRIEHRTWNTY